ncbi:MULTISPECIES: glutathione S-transferase family protein [unclassified Agarivorans]|uniref:glutathione S-transferase family protein n=1 Tax=unclassified Agarivorans TaxID=2636026 RepID=UPI0026E2942E|nr:MULTISPECIES: glutathione S-transferase [unclassified Agarivorans]MDO6684356.1 glutathione S-transferase [Agarivorans sp. 3_MG-2023]MDO6714521.1 glutathione S-transferase [Agarivorans sp. 2_MG-2023]
MLKLYDFELSGHAHRARLMLALLKLPYEKVTVNLAQGEHKQDDYRAINPFTQVPVLDDDGLVIRDSIAIITHLANRYAPEWNPQTVNEQAEIQQWLALAARTLAEGPARARLITVFGAQFDQAAVIAASHQTLEIVNQLLNGKQWMAANKPTIADIACYSYIAHAPEGKVALDAYPNILAWLSNVEALDGFEGMQKTPLQPAV